MGELSWSSCRQQARYFRCLLLAHAWSESLNATICYIQRNVTIAAASAVCFLLFLNWARSVLVGTSMSTSTLFSRSARGEELSSYSSFLMPWPQTYQLMSDAMLSSLIVVAFRNFWLCDVALFRQYIQIL